MTTPSSAVSAGAPASLTTTVGPGGRIHTLDLLRGFALLGMILVHFHQYMETEAGGLEGWIGWFTWLGVETKAWGTFAFLFGVGFAVLLRGFEARGAPIVAFYLRRLFGLAVFGFIAEAFFGFHVLLEYAIWGLPLLLMRRWSNRALIVVALVSLACSPLLQLGSTAYRSIGRGSAGSAIEPSAAASSAVDAERRVNEAVEAASAGGRYAPLLRSRLERMRVKYSHWGVYTPGVNLALFVIGLLACRRGVFDEPKWHWRLIVAVMTFGFLSWTLSWLLFAFAPGLMSNAYGRAIGTGFGLIHDQWLCFTYIGALTLLIAWRPAWQERLSLIGAAGRMALTNYMLQVAALDFLASGYGAGLRVRPLFSVLGTVLLFGVLAVLSRWWLSRFRFGPAEWLWRCFTYLRIQPLRQARGPGAALEAA